VRLRIYTRHRQGGAVAASTVLMLAVLVGFLGVVVDLGRMFVAKTELFNAADACALAAAQELDGGAGALTRAENAGIAAGTRNRADFQNTPVAITAADIKFSTTLSPNSSYLTQAAGAPQTSRYAMCTLNFPGLPTTLTAVVGFGPSVNVGAQAVATLAPSQSSCAIPLGMCSNGPAPGYGLTAGQWRSGRFDAGGGLTGSFNWIDFTPPGGGQSELAALLTGQGMCATTVNQPVGQTGVMGNAAGSAWNSRFGLYQGGGGNPQLTTAPPDFTGYAYTATPQGQVAWPAQSNALSDFMARRATNAPYQGNAATGLSINPSYNISTPTQHAQFGAATRRLVVSPIVNCAGWASSQTVPILSYGCVLMLHPIGSPGDTVYMEYRGLASDPGSPCATSGLAGGTFGPLIPVLVQ
jgi:Flp pilus assembly protein TadG